MNRNTSRSSTTEQFSGPSQPVDRPIYPSLTPQSVTDFGWTSNSSSASSSLTASATSNPSTLLPSPITTDSRKYSRPASLRSWSSTTQMATAVTATGSTASSPSTSHFPSSGPVPIPLPGRAQANAANYRSTNATAVGSSPTSWSLSRNSERYGSSETVMAGNGGRKLAVTINVYDMLQDSRFSELVWILGIGVYHSAVEVDGREYAYGGHEEPSISGVYYSKPLTPLPGGIVCRTSIFHGYTMYSPAEVHAIINDLSSEYMGSSYNLLYKNCNHFTNSLLERLTNKPAPAWLNRATVIGSALPCIVPQTFIQPPECEAPIRPDSLYSTNEKSYDDISVAPPSIKRIPSQSLWKKSSAKVASVERNEETEPFVIGTRYVDESAVSSEAESDGEDEVSLDIKKDSEKAKEKPRTNKSGYEKIPIAKPLRGQIEENYRRNDTGSSNSMDTDGGSALSRFFSGPGSFWNSR